MSFSVSLLKKGKPHKTITSLWFNMNISLKVFKIVSVLFISPLASRIIQFIFVIKLPFDFVNTPEIFLAILFSVIKFFWYPNPLDWEKICATYNIFHDHRLLSVNSFWVQIPILWAYKEGYGKDFKISNFTEASNT
jgi:hypothetical protein